MIAQFNSKPVTSPNPEGCVTSLSPNLVLSMRQSQARFKYRLALLTIAIMEFGLTAPLDAQIFTTVHNFNGEDGREPQLTRLVLSGTTLYGLTSMGGAYGRGNVFTGNTDGTGFRSLYSFTDTSSPTNSDGAQPVGLMVLLDNTIYGVANNTGKWGNGTIFAVKTDGTGFTVLHSFGPGTTYNPFPYLTNGDGAMPSTGLGLFNNTLYGTTWTGGSSGVGTVFAINTDGTGFKVLHNFTGGISDGANPQAGTTLSGNWLYGTTQGGGSSGMGTVFAINTDGTGFRLLHSFNGVDDGACPVFEVVFSGETLYGTTGGQPGTATASGTLFALNIDGTGFVTLHTFDPKSAPWPVINSDGVGPGALVLSGRTLYGTTSLGGTFGSGTVFKVKTDGTDFTTIHTFTIPVISGANPGTNSDGCLAKNPLMLSGNTLYGMAAAGGTLGYGTVFSITLPIQPPMSVIPSRGNLILSWPTNATRLTLQSTTNLVSPVWTTNLPQPSVVNGQNQMIIPMSDTQRFFRLIQ